MNHLLRWRMSHAFQTLPPVIDRGGVSTRPRPAVDAMTWIRMGGLRPLATKCMN